jgi:hypothetical protein
MTDPNIPNTNISEGGDAMPNDNVVDATNGKEKKMQDVYIFERLINIGEGQSIWAQVVTNRPNPNELELYNRLVALREDNHIIAAEIKLRREKGVEFRIKSIGENFRFHMLQGRILRKGYDFRLEYIKLKERDEFGNVQDLISPEQVPMLAERIKMSSRSWSTSTSTNILFIAKKSDVVPWDGFDITLGLHTGNSRKQSKREAENSRVTELGVDLAEEFINIHIYDYDEDEMGVDGHYLISETLFRIIVNNIPNEKRRAQILRAYEKGEMLSFNVRILCSLGLIKGDCHVVKDAQLKAKYGYVPHVITHKCNIKEEKGTVDGSFSITLTPYHPHHMPNVSTQLLSWGLGFFISEAELMEDFTAMTNEFVTSVAEGQFPKHLMSAAPLHDEDDDFNNLSFINALHDATQRWLTSGMKVTHSSHLVKMHAGGFENKTIRAIRDLRMPMGWATLTHCITVAILEMGNWDLSGYDTSKMFWHAETGRMCWPTEDFVANYHRHGGHDLDDSHITMLRAKKVEKGDNPNITWNLGGDDWCIKAVNVRSPNGLSYFGENELPGEYSMLDIDLDIGIMQFGFIALPVINFPLYNVWNSIPGIDMDNAPQHTHVQEIDSVDMPDDGYELGDKYSPDDAVRQFMLAMANPGIGQIINPLIAYSSIFGTYPKWLPTYLEQMVDALEQTPDFEAFKKVLEAKKQLLIAIQHHTKRPVDHYIAARRVPGTVFNALKAQGRITEDSPYFRLIEFMKATLQQAMEILVGNRASNPSMRTKGINITQRLVIEDLMSMEVPHEAKVAAYDLIRYYEPTRKLAPKANYRRDAATRLFLKKNDPYLSFAARQYFIRLNNECYKRITEHEVDTNHIITALYQIIITENKEDDILFQTSDVGTTTGVMDLFMKTLWDELIIDTVIDSDGTVLG